MVTDFLNLNLYRRLIFTLFLGMLILSASAHAEGILLDRVVAIVNNDIILNSELQMEMLSVQKKIEAANAPVLTNQEIRAQAIERLIVHKLQMAEAKELGISVDDETLLKAVNNIANRNNITLEQLEQALQREGMTLEYYREDLREQIILSRLRNREVMARIQVTDAEIDNYLEHVDQQPGGRTAFHLRHILIATPEGASSTQIQKARVKAENLITELRGGADFAAIAVRESAGRHALEGGDLGWLEADSLPSLFSADAATMERGAVAGPMQTASGFHIIKLEDYKGGDRNIVKQTHARHILIRTNELTSDNDARTRLEQLYLRINNGEDFTDLARTNSDDKASAIKGGDLGWVSPGTLVAKFEEVMDSMEINELSEPFQTQFGWHIVQVLERRDHDATEEVRRDKARTALREQKADEALELYIRKLRDQAYVDIRPDDF